MKENSQITPTNESDSKALEKAFFMNDSKQRYDFLLDYVKESYPINGYHVNPFNRRKRDIDKWNYIIEVIKEKSPFRVKAEKSGILHFNLGWNKLGAELGKIEQQREVHKQNEVSRGLYGSKNKLINLIRRSKIESYVTDIVKTANDKVLSNEDNILFLVESRYGIYDNVLIHEEENILFSNEIKKEIQALLWQAIKEIDLEKAMQYEQEFMRG